MLKHYHQTAGAYEDTISYIDAAGWHCCSSIPVGAYYNPDCYSLTAYFSFGEAQTSVRCVEEQTLTGEERTATLRFDSSEVTEEHSVTAVSEE